MSEHIILDKRHYDALREGAIDCLNRVQPISRALIPWRQRVRMRAKARLTGRASWSITPYERTPTRLESRRIAPDNPRAA